MCAKLARVQCKTVALAAFLLAGCAGTPGPDGRLPLASEYVVSARGAWIEVYDQKGRRSVEGELLEVAPDGLVLLTTRGLQTVPSAPNIRVRSISYDNQADKLSTMAALGSVMSIGNGFFMVFTAPLIWIGGAVSSQAQAGEGVTKVSSDQWELLARDARFPGGMPPGVDPAALTLPTFKSARQAARKDFSRR